MDPDSTIVFWVITAPAATIELLLHYAIIHNYGSYQNIIVDGTAELWRCDQ
jgi:hypothetical protein